MRSTTTAVTHRRTMSASVHRTVLVRSSETEQTLRVRRERVQEKKCAVVLPGLGRGAADYRRLSQNMAEQGYVVEICAVRTIDWLRNASGLTDGNYWRGMLNPRPTVNWYLNRIEQSINKAKHITDGAPITIVAHSAGGWLARIYMKDYGTTGIENLVTLGSPHNPPPKGVFDQTRGILSFCEDEIPGCFHSNVNYVTIAGKYLKGSEWNSDGTLRQKLIGSVYKQVCGDANVWGDGVVPSVSAHLDGATNIDLDNVFHGPITEPDDDSRERRIWYGSKEIMNQWLDLISTPVQNRRDLN